MRAAGAQSLRSLPSAALAIFALRWRRMASPHGRSELAMAAPRLVIIAEFQVKAECVEECARVLCESARGSRAEPGCVRFDVLRDETDPCRHVSNMLAWIGLASPLLVGHGICICS